MTDRAFALRELGRLGALLMTQIEALRADPDSIAKRDAVRGTVAQIRSQAERLTAPGARVSR